MRKAGEGRAQPELKPGGFALTPHPGLWALSGEATPVPGYCYPLLWPLLVSCRFLLLIFPLSREPHFLPSPQLSRAHWPPL